MGDYYVCSGRSVLEIHSQHSHQEGLRRCQRRHLPTSTNEELETVCCCLACIGDGRWQKKRNFRESIDLRVNLRDLDTRICKRFGVQGPLPHIHSPKQRIIVFTDAPVKVADPDVEIVDTTRMLSFHRSRKRIKKFLTKKCATIADGGIIKKIPRCLGPQPNKMSKFPSLFEIDDLQEAITSCRRRCQWKLKKDLTLSAIVGHSNMSSIQLFENIQAAIEILGPVLQKWKKLQSLVLKSSMGHPFFIFKRDISSNPEQWMPQVRGHYSAAGSHRTVHRPTYHMGYWRRRWWYHWNHETKTGHGHAKKKTARLMARKHKKDR
eukprot:TRINITY_DN1519_c0_g1_i1.p1 TRINITY_DN1519_c0_g1~~TRINITY_DN1519_c0_g1_i1.p1  ORF type:complete len:321 (-),score=40.13 TRINITY_DN1519_c0_g1_i1:44-1006(-)